MAEARGARTGIRFAGGIGLATVIVAAIAMAAPAWAQGQAVPTPKASPAKSAPAAKGAAAPWAPAAVAPAATAAAKTAAPAAGAKAAAPAVTRPPSTASDAFDGEGDADMELIDAGSSGDGMDDGEPADFAEPAAPPVPDVGPPKDIRPGSFTLEARLAADGPALKDGVKWRIFGDKPGTDGRLPQLGEMNGGVIYIRLDPGIYYVHAAYGRAGQTRKVEVKQPTGGQVFVMNAGGMRLFALNGKDQRLANAEVSFDIYAPDASGSDERFLLIPNAPPGRVIGLNSGTYHVVSRYGDANAIVRADIRVDAGKLTEATVYQKAARLTLKLVQAHGGEAVADTAWSVLAPTGEVVVESVGAFPSVVLAAGEYRAVAKHAGRTFESSFKVETAVNRDVEVLLR